MEDKDLKNIIQQILNNYKQDLVEVDKAISQIIAMTGSGNMLNTNQVKLVSKKLESISKESFIAAGGTIQDWKIWYEKRNKINLN